jgi:hypothetical protein
MKEERCDSYGRERLEMMSLILDEDDGVTYERTGDEWIAMIVGLLRGVTATMTEWKAISGQCMEGEEEVGRSGGQGTVEGRSNKDRITKP